MTQIIEGAMEGQLVAVAGAAGNVGEGITRALLRAGARVAALSRSEENLAALRAQLAGEATERLLPVVGDTSSFDGFREVAGRIVAEHGPIDHAVASLAWGWPGKPVWEISEEELDAFYARNQKVHFAAARALVPALRARGSYTIVAGLSAVLPIPGASALAMQAAAHLMLGASLQADAGDRVRVNSLVLGFILSRTRLTGEPTYLHANEVGEAIVRIAASDLRGQTIRADDRNVAARALEALAV